MLQNLRPVEILVLVLIVLLLFGARKLPELAKSIGQSLKIFRKEVHELSDTTPASVAPEATPTAHATEAPTPAPADTASSPVEGAPR